MERHFYISIRETEEAGYRKLCTSIRGVNGRRITEDLMNGTPVFMVQLWPGTGLLHQHS